MSMNNADKFMLKLHSDQDFSGTTIRTLPELLHFANKQGYDCSLQELSMALRSN